MTVKELQTHIGCLIRIKNKIYWYGGRGWDEDAEKLCILLNSKSLSSPEGGRCAATCAIATSPQYALQLLIESEIEWVWACDNSFEIVK